ncbi:MAG: antitoxin [Planctomycetota bacterium]
MTLDQDVELLLREAMHRSRRSFKETLNCALRSGLGVKPVRAGRARFVVKARPMGLRAGFDPAGFNKLADDLEIDSVMG